MGFEISRAFEIENGLLFEGGCYVFSGDISPIGVDSPIGSVYIQKTLVGFDLWEKFGANVSDWKVKSSVNNFSYKEVFEPITIPSTQQMIVNNSIRVESELRIDGEAYVCQFPEVEPFPELPDDNFSFFEITGNKEVKSGQEMVLTQFLKVDGLLRVDGQVSLLGSIEEETSPVIPNKILMGQFYKIAQDFEHYFRGFLNNSGALRVSGSFIVGA